MHRLEVIVTSATEAVAAADGGADRLELIRALDNGGLTPVLETVLEVIEATSTPVRVMLRGNSSMSLAGPLELHELEKSAASLSRLPLDGLVMGWVSRTSEVDVRTLEAVLAAAPQCKVTFHRAFEHVRDPAESLRLLRRYPQIDRILTSGGKGSWTERKRRLLALSKAAAPEIGIIVGGGLSTKQVADLMADPRFPEVHVGRPARTPQQNSGAVDRGRVAFLKNLQAQ